MSLTAEVRAVNGRPMLVINGEPTGEFWCYGLPNALPDFAAGGVRICQFHVTPGATWWLGPGRYDLAGVERQIDEFVALRPDVLLIPRVSFGYQGEGWWGVQHPEELAVGQRADGTAADYRQERAHPVECWQSAGSEVWTRDAAAALADFVRHLEARSGRHILGYQVGGGISSEWFRWWNFVDGAYEDYSPAAVRAFRAFLRDRYGSDGGLRAAWGRDDVALATAAVPAAARLHAPALGFFRDPARERDVIDWLECLSELNVRQMLALCAAAKAACGRRKLVGVFYGYLWPHWNTQNPARAGHLALARVLASPDVDYISSPYHYDHRSVGGVHHSQTVPQAIERAGKLHLDEIDTTTHLVDDPAWWPNALQGVPPDAEASCRLLRRDAAAVLGTAGSAWWMDLRHARWYADPQIQAELRRLQALARQMGAEPADPRAEVAWVVDEGSYACCDLNSNLNQYFTALPRQFEWSDLGLPVDTLLLSEVAAARPYRLYMLLNAWRVDAERRRVLLERLRRPGVTAVWFYGAGLCDGQRCSAESAGALVGMRLRMQMDPVVPEIVLAEHGHPWLAAGGDPPRGRTRFGARLSEERQRGLVTVNPRGWDTPAAPLLAVDDPAAVVLGRYVHDGSAGLALVERAGWRSVYCGAPLLPGWLLRRMALAAGAHAYAPAGCVVHHRGPLLAVYVPAGGRVRVAAPPGQGLVELEPEEGGGRSARGPAARRDGGGQGWVGAAAPAGELTLEFAPGQTRFFRCG